MSTLGSWIDKDELAAVVAQLVPVAGPVPVEVESAPVPVSETSGHPPITGTATEMEGEAPAGESAMEDQVAAVATGSITGELVTAAEAPAPAPAEEEAVGEAPMADVPTGSAPDESPMPLVESVGETGPETAAEEALDGVVVTVGATAHAEVMADLPPMDESQAGATGHEEPPPLNFNQPGAYEAAAFPFEEPIVTGPESPVSPLRRTAAVQASVALERARDRAEQGGLLKQFGPETTAVDLETPAFDSPVVLIDPLPDVSPPPLAETDLEAENPAHSAGESTSGSSLRERLLGFANRTAEATGSPDVAITDFQSYPLLIGSQTVASPDSALRLAHWFGSLSRELKASRDGVSQIALTNGNWLGIVAADSAAGGVCASFRTSEPIPAERAKQLTQDLRETLEAG